MSFASFALRDSVLAGVRNAGYEKPTPIQQQAIPAVLDNRDVLGLARTGTGKTAAFVLPILHRLSEGPRGKIRALIVAPTRELAEQINSDITTLGRHTGLRSATVYGGVGKAPQVRAMRGRAEIIVACPGRLLDHVSGGDANLSSVEMLVLDEADHMFDMGFLPDVRRIVAKVPHGAQRLLFSATMPPELRKLAEAILTEPVTIEIENKAPTHTVDHALYPVSADRKLGLLKHLLESSDFRSALIFTRTKHGAQRLAKRLGNEGQRIATLQGNLSQNQRQRALDGFRDGSYNVLVATDIAARGIDVSLVSHVINFDVPSTAEAYTHRIGRTGRAEKTGEAFTLVSSEDAKAVRAIEKVLGAPLRRVVVDGFGGEAEARALASGGDGNGRGRSSRSAGGRGNDGAGSQGADNGRGRSGGQGRSSSTGRRQGAGGAERGRGPDRGRNKHPRHRSEERSDQN